jgi:membrane-bound lytic murein transglycosylase B
VRRALPALVPALTLALALTGCTGGTQEPAAAPTTAAPTPPASPSSSASPTPSPSASPAGPVTAQLPPPVDPDPATLAARLTAAEQTIRTSSDDAAVAEAGAVQQAAYRALAARPEWRRQVLDAVPPELRDVVVAHVDALTDLRRLTRAQPRLPAWRIVAPRPADELLGHYRAAEQEFGVRWEYLAAIHLVESRMGRIRGTSPAGAQGPMQFLPQTWDAFGEGDINDPRDAIRAAGRYLKAHGAPGDMPRALYAYNHSQAYVRAITVHADQMRAEPRTYRGYYHWQVYYRTTEGDRVLPVGYDGSR